MQSRSILQITSGAKRGLLCQVVAIEGNTLKCLAREVDSDRGHFFDVPLGDGYVVCGGTAALGPKPKDQTEPPKPALPPPLNLQELLEPIPADVKAVPMLDEADIPPAVPLPPEALRKARGPKRRLQPIFMEEQPKAPPPPPVKKEMYTARVTNASGDQIVVTVAVPEGKPLSRCNGTAVLIASNIIPNVKPFTVSDWTKVENTNETLGESGHREGNADVGAAQEQVAPTSQTAG